MRYTEGIAYAYEIALLKKDSIRAAKYITSLRLSMINLRSLQYSAKECADVKFPKRSIGTFRTSITNPWSRIDTSQHIIDSLRKLRSIKIEK